MNKATRHQQILLWLQQQKNCRVTVLAQRLETSVVTIRSDLSQLEKEHKVCRMHGQVVLNPGYLQEMKIQQREARFREAKQAIVRKAASYVKDGDFLLMDSGSTINQITQYIPRSYQCTIATNDLALANKLIADPRFTVMMTGGELHADSNALYGEAAERMLELYRFDRLFLGADGVDPKLGVTTAQQRDARLNRVMQRVSNQVILLADSSKAAQQEPYLICDLSQIDVFITDSGLPMELRQSFSEANVSCVIADT